jgi:hypothetical protein
VREYNTYDKYGLLQGLLDALGKHAKAIPLQARVDIATDLIASLPEYAEDIVVDVAPRMTQRERYKQQRATSSSPTAPTLSKLGEMIAH